MNVNKIELSSPQQAEDREDNQRRDPPTALSIDPREADDLHT
jgi:hypothetical protein